MDAVGIFQHALTYTNMVERLMEEAPRTLTGALYIARHVETWQKTASEIVGITPHTPLMRKRDQTKQGINVTTPTSITKAMN